MRIKQRPLAWPERIWSMAALMSSRGSTSVNSSLSLIAAGKPNQIVKVMAQVLGIISPQAESA